MIKFEDYPILQGHLSTLQEISIDDHEKDNVQYMTDSQRMVVNFDKVKEEYISNLSLVEVPKSNDALFLSRDNKLIFVEFKNGFMDGKKKFDVRKKIYDRLAKEFLGMAKKEYVCFGVNIFKNYCFKAIHTFTEKEFEAYLEKN